MMPNSALTRSLSIVAQGSDPRPPAPATAIASSDAADPAIGASRIGRSMPVRSWKRRSICMGKLRGQRNEPGLVFEPASEHSLTALLSVRCDFTVAPEALQLLTLPRPGD